jgi:hypothetical protein
MAARGTTFSTKVEKASLRRCPVWEASGLSRNNIKGKERQKKIANAIKTV